MNQQVTLRDEFVVCDYRFHPRCHGRNEVDATWSSTGGSLQVIDGGKEAPFSASSPGVYTVIAKYSYLGWRLEGQATVTVTSP